MTDKAEVVVAKQAQIVPADEEVIAQHEEDQMIAMIERIVMTPEIPIDRLEKMLEMRERIEEKKAEQEFNVAMSEVQAEITPIIANKKGQNNNYATYDQVDREIRPIYTKHGFSLTFNTEKTSNPGEIDILCYVSHNLGYSRTYSLAMPADGKGAKGGDVMTKTHAAGSALSYGMRYLLGLIFNLAIIKDDDGIAASLKVETITEEQQATVQDLLDSTEADKARFLKWAKVAKISEINAGAYKSVVEMIKRKK